MQVTFNVKEYFFDRAEVQARAGKMRAAALKVAGSYIRRKARDLLRRGKKAAKPGKPPKVHSSEPNLRTVLYFLDPSSDSMVVGPVGLNRRPKQSDADTVPQLLEFGGRGEVTEYSADGGSTWIDGDERRKARYRGKFLERRKRQAQFAAHPFMSVAMEKALPSIPEKFRDLL